jgi:lipopolysaccharide transport system permease protein
MVIPLAAMALPLTDLFIGGGILSALLLCYGAAPGWGVLWLPLLALWAGAAALAAALWLGPLGVKYRDVTHALPFLVQAGLFASPVIYPSSLVPEGWRAVYGLNPMAAVLDGFRWALLGAPAPAFPAWAGAAALTALALLCGLIFFRRMERSFADVV